jgi:glycosyltransferase involved in cell wall biosynthesis
MLSIVVPVFNGEQYIKETVLSLLNVEKPENTEIIIVDDGSTDNTKEILTQFKQIQYYFQKNAGPASARNHGARLAKGEVLFFTDADCRPHTDWVVKLLLNLTEMKVAVVSGSYGIANQSSRLARCVQNEIIYRHNRLMPDYPKVFGSYNFAIEKKVFDELGGFNVKYRNASGEDNDLSYKIIKAGYRIYFAKDALVDHFHPEKIFRYLKEQFRHGFWRAKIYLDFPDMGKGDDYTFWKDMIEVPLIGLVFCSAAMSLLQFPSAGKMLLILNFGLWIFEIFWAWKMTNNVIDSLYFGSVTTLRAYVRTIGFVKGWGRFLWERFASKNTN